MVILSACAPSHEDVHRFIRLPAATKKKNDDDEHENCFALWSIVGCCRDALK